jgi:hypothetical protein
MRWKQRDALMEDLQDSLIDAGWALPSVARLSKRISTRNGASAEIVEILREVKEVEECSPGSRQAVDN